MLQLNTVLLVDDDATSIFLTQIVLEEFNPNIKVLTAANGKEASVLLNNCEGIYPDLIFLDINMPLMTGIEFLYWYHNSAHVCETSICMFTTSIQPTDNTRCFSFSDVIAYVEKPLSPEKISHVLTRNSKIS